ncbi:tachykinin-like peptides receptor 86C [Anoplophora glabripennis]|uniref:tachykinin-like peptides receptor 86C n=1 Tax=Anoplophora glabripennis TaxID=217634 RepID=UPI00087506CB|nr:tachykinin-like peptides receptor 86C [Anoplophora glabripennis]
MIFAIPCLLYSTTITNRYKGIQRTGCILVWPDEKIIGSKYDFWYQTLFLFITYIVPMILMSVCYTTMGRVLWGSSSIGEMTQRQLDAIRSKRKVVKMFISVVLIFGICWLPYHAYFIYIYYDTNVIFSKYTQHVYLGFYWFAMSNAMVNPLIYYWMNARFRQYFKSAICGWNICRFNRNEDSPAIGRHSHSFSKSGADGSTKIRISSPREKEQRYQNGNSLKQYSPMERGNSSEKDGSLRDSRRNSNRWSSRSITQGKQKRTTNL